MQTLDALQSRLSVNVNDGTGIISVTRELADPRAAAEITKVAIELLKEYMREYRTQK